MEKLKKEIEELEKTIKATLETATAKEQQEQLTKQQAYIYN